MSATPASSTATAAAATPGASKGSSSSDGFPLGWVALGVVVLVLVVALLAFLACAPVEDAKDASPEQIAALFDGKGSHRALLMGCNYTGSPYALHGCVSDVDSVRSLLVSLGWAESDIAIMTDATDVKPTARNMREAIAAFAASLDADAVAFVWYSGHGAIDLDASGVPCESWCPLDFERAGMLHGTDIRRWLEATQCAVFVGADACHSGNLLQLRYSTRDDVAWRSGPAAVPAGAGAGKGVASIESPDWHGWDSFPYDSPGSVAPSPAQSTPGSGSASASVSACTSPDDLAKRAEQARHSHHHDHHSVKLSQAHRDIGHSLAAEAMSAPPVAITTDPSKNEMGGKLVYFGGCADAGTSADTSFGGRASGAATYAFTTAMKSLPLNATVNSTLYYVRALLRSAGFPQVPQVALGSAGVGTDLPLLQMLKK